MVMSLDAPGLTMGAEFENLLAHLSDRIPAPPTCLPQLDCCPDRHQEALSFNAAATSSAHINRVLAACSFQFVTSHSPNGVGVDAEAGAGAGSGVGSRESGSCRS